MSKKTWPKPKVGISSCLLGNRVRHNGEHKKNDWIYEQLGPHVRWLAICPEVEMGLGVPRETLRLIGTSKSPQLVIVKTQEDLTQKAQKVFDRLLKKEWNFEAFIFKKDSPSCGLERVKVYGNKGIPSKVGVGLFAERIKEKFPLIPMIEEGRLTDLEQREQFLIRLFTWAKLNSLPPKIKNLQEFHQNHKLQLMAFDPLRYRYLGQIAGNSQSKPFESVIDEYRIRLHEILNQPLTSKKNINAFQHMLGFFKKELNSKEKKHILGLFDDYKRGKISLMSITVVFKYLLHKYSVSYLEGQTLLEPYPDSILLSKS